MKVIDLRSDTVTLPTLEMRKAIAEAKLGDAVFGEDPTVTKLETMAADRTGMEAGLLVVSGTQGNLVSMLVHCQRGDEVIVGDRTHTNVYEAGGISVFGGVKIQAVPNDDWGRLAAGDIEAAIRIDDAHYPNTALICLENTNVMCGGAPLMPEDIAPIAQVAEHHGVPMHLDGARLFNASVALGVDVKQLTSSFSSLSFCLSKGLSCPVGSVVCGGGEFIYKARKILKVLGGGMRQAGIIAAAGIVALDGMIDRLAEDHSNAGVLAEGLSKIPGLGVDPEHTKTNMVQVQIVEEHRYGITEALERKGVLVATPTAKKQGPAAAKLRLVTHYGIESADIDQVIEAFREVMA